MACQLSFTVVLSLYLSSAAGHVTRVSLVYAPMLLALGAPSVSKHRVVCCFSVSYYSSSILGIQSHENQFNFQLKIEYGHMVANEQF